MVTYQGWCGLLCPEVCHELLRVGTSCPTEKTLLCHFTDKLLYEAQVKRPVTEKLLHAPDHRTQLRTQLRTPRAAPLILPTILRGRYCYYSWVTLKETGQRELRHKVTELRHKVRDSTVTFPVCGGCCSVTKSCLTLQSHELQHPRLACPSLSP